MAKSYTLSQEHAVMQNILSLYHSNFALDVIKKQNSMSMTDSYDLPISGDDYYHLISNIILHGYDESAYVKINTQSQSDIQNSVINSNNISLIKSVLEIITNIHNPDLKELILVIYNQLFVCFHGVQPILTPWMQKEWDNNSNLHYYTTQCDILTAHLDLLKSR